MIQPRGSKEKAWKMPQSSNFYLSRSPRLLVTCILYQNVDLVLELKGTTENIWFNPVFGLVRCDYPCFKGETSKAQAGASLGCS